MLSKMIGIVSTNFIRLKNYELCAATLNSVAKNINIRLLPGMSSRKWLICKFYAQVDY
jgi:hypothetical protein